MNFFEAMLERKVTVKFLNKEVDDKLIGLLLHSATYAPSAGNLQEWRFVVVRDEKIKEKLSRFAKDEKRIMEAPVNIVVCSDVEATEAKYGEKGDDYAIQDASFVAMTILIGARSLGLGGVLIRNFDVEKIIELLDLPKVFKPSFIIPIGYVAEEEEIKRIPNENLTSMNRYGRKYEAEITPVIDYMKELFEKGRKESKKTGKKKIFYDFEEFLRKLSA